jgi:transcriptional regulator with XRE-family HTH domain
MQVLWTGADATALRDALQMPQREFAARAGVSLSVVKKWARRKTTIELQPFFGELVDGMLKQATREQRRRFLAAHEEAATKPAPDLAVLEPDRVEVLPPAPLADIWSGDCSTLTHDMTRRDLMLDRRRVSKAIAGVVVGVYLLEPLERWLLRDSDDAPTEPPIIGTGLQEIAELESAARIFREWDDQFGGGLRRKAVVGQLDEVNEVLDNPHPPEIKRRLRRVRALLAETAATMSWDSGE